MADETSLEGRKLLLGVSGGIAAYKTPLLVRLLKKSGAEVQVLMTPDAARFVTPLTLGTVSERPVHVDIFAEHHGTSSWTQHVELGLWADLFVVAPATAQTLAKLAQGFCDSMLTASALAARCPMVVFPSMDHDMYQHAATQRNLAQLKEDGVEVMAPGYGELASGLTGHGRLPEPEEIFEHIASRLGKPRTPMTGKSVLVTAGPTQEPIDPVRFISNHSTGTMGYALAEASARRGANVVLVSGPTSLNPPPGVDFRPVRTAREMHEAVLSHCAVDMVLMAAAVSDFAPASPSDTKMKKADSDDEPVLELRRTPDILLEVGQRKRPGQILVGFAMETGNGLEEARRKLQSKNLDAIVLNDLTEPGAGFGTTTNRVTLLFPNGDNEVLPLKLKRDVAEEILEAVLARHPS